jgi:hypothetical protein
LSICNNGATNTLDSKLGTDVYASYIMVTRSFLSVKNCSDKVKCNRHYMEPGWRSRYSDWLLAGRLRGRSSSPGRVKNFLQIVQTASAVHPTSYPMGAGDILPRVKRSGREADHSLSTGTAFTL